MKDTLKKLYFLLTIHERKKAYLLSTLILFMALLEMVGIASIMPFVGLLTNPELIERNELLSKLYNFFLMYGGENKDQFLFFCGVLVFILLLLSLCFKALVTYLQLRFTSILSHNLGLRLLEGYLNQSYSWFLNRNSSDLSKSILSEVGTVVGNGIKPIINLVVFIMTSLVILSLLIFVNIKLTLSVVFMIGSIYLLIYKFARNLLMKIGKKRFEDNQQRFKSINEAIGGAKIIKLGGLEEYFIQKFCFPSKNIARNSVIAGSINQLPRFALEAIIFGSMMLVIMYLMILSGDFITVAPIIALYAFASYRLIPALQNIYINFAQLRYGVTAIKAIYDELRELKLKLPDGNNKILSINKTISLNHIYYNYPNTSRTSLKDINMNIKVHSTVGIIGSTGSGKTTTVDIILGLLEAQQGTLEVDGQVISKNNIRSWQSSIGYVPQDIYLFDNTISANIAFGNDPEKINQKKVEEVAKIANIHEFVVNELPEKYYTKVGERGVRLSGGQLQRIGIARALYNNPQILILDEATSALDNQTEKYVMDAINKLEHQITIILIAHRLGTMKNCDNIFRFEEGKIIEQGKYNELIKNSKFFR